MRANIPVPSTPHLAYADALRALAIALVVINHLAIYAQPKLGRHEFTLSYLGAWGVNCFFVLSGFLLGGSYVRALLNDDVPFPSTAHFYGRRFLRIYPLYFFAVVVSVAVCFALPALPALSSNDIVSHVLMLHALSPQTATTLNGPLWTMPLDMLFYLVLPLGAYGLRLLLANRPRPSRIRIFAAAMIVAASLCLVYRFIAFRAHPEAVGGDFAAGVVYVRNLPGMAIAFILGIGGSLLVALNRQPTQRTARVLLGTGIVIALASIFFRLDSSGPVDTRMLVRLTLVDPLAAISCLLVLLGAAASRIDMLSRLISSRVVVFTASLAYAVYLLHWPLIEVLEAAALHHRIGGSAFLMLGGLTAVSILPIAYLAHRFVERPALELKDRVREAGAAPASA